MRKKTTQFESLMSSATSACMGTQAPPSAQSTPGWSREAAWDGGWQGLGAGHSWAQILPQGLVGFVLRHLFSGSV